VDRRNRIALLVALVLLVALAGTALATRAPRTADEPGQVTQEQEEEAEAPPSAEDLAHAVDRLSEAGYEVPAGTDFTELATAYGVGGAVRVVAWSYENQEGLDIAAIRRMRDGDGTEENPGMGWGQIAKELDLHPGIGSIMGNGGGQGHGRENAPGQQDRGTDEGDDSGG
jgi:hypothetical protein